MALYNAILLRVWAQIHPRNLFAWSASVFWALLNPMIKWWSVSDSVSEYKPIRFESWCVRWSWGRWIWIWICSRFDLCKYEITLVNIFTWSFVKVSQLTQFALLFTCSLSTLLFTSSTILPELLSYSLILFPFSVDNLWITTSFVSFWRFITTLKQFTGNI